MPSLQSSQRQMDIVFTVNCIHILVDIIIIDMICVNFVLRVVFFRGVVVTITTQPKFCHIAIDTLRMISSL
jgi:hypothetical protein